MLAALALKTRSSLKTLTDLSSARRFDFAVRRRRWCAKATGYHWRGLSAAKGREKSNSSTQAAEQSIVVSATSRRRRSRTFISELTNPHAGRSRNVRFPPIVVIRTRLKIVALTGLPLSGRTRLHLRLPPLQDCCADCVQQQRQPNLGRIRNRGSSLGNRSEGPTSAYCHG